MWVIDEVKHVTSSQKVISYRNFLAEDRFATEAKKTQKLVILELQFISNAFFLSEKKKFWLKEQ